LQGKESGKSPCRSCEALRQAKREAARRTKPGVSNIEITDRNIKDFERIARKYGIDFALKKDKSGEIPKYLVFFKARDADALTAAFKEYTAKTDRKKEKPSILKKLRRFKDMSATLDTPKVRKKELDAR